MKTNKKVPITRVNKFFSQGDFDLEKEFGREWLEGDINIKVILFQVKQGESTTDDIYGESNNVKTGYYNSYKDIKWGSLIYYTDLDNDLPYTSPNFQIQSFNRPSVLKDPMDSTKTYYIRVPIPSEKQEISEYSFDRDQMEFREDLISKQQDVFLKNDYTSYHFYKDL